MSHKKLHDLTSTELSSELTKAGIHLSGKNVDDKEKFLRLSTHLIDKGEDPISYEFPLNSTDHEDPSEKVQSERMKLLEKVVKFEKCYFTKDKSRGL